MGKGGDGRAQGNGQAWDCKATAQCGVKGNFGWRSCCRGCGRLPNGLPSVDLTKSPTRSVVPANSKAQAEIAELKKQLNELKAAGAPPPQPAPDDDDEVEKLEGFFKAAVAAFGDTHEEATRAKVKVEAARRKRAAAKPLRTQAIQAEKKVERHKKAAEAASAKELSLRTELEAATAAAAAARAQLDSAEQELLAIRTAALEEAGGAALPAKAPEAVRALFPKDASFTPAQAALLDQVSALLSEAITFKQAEEQSADTVQGKPDGSANAPEPVRVSPADFEEDIDEAMVDAFLVATGVAMASDSASDSAVAEPPAEGDQVKDLEAKRKAVREQIKMVRKKPKRG